MARVWLIYLLKIVIFHGVLHVYQRVGEHYGKVMENRGKIDNPFVSRVCDFLIPVNIEVYSG
jgi:hypothetical protein